MFLKNNYIISFLTILLLKRTVRPWEFSPVEDNVVITTEAQIRFIIITFTKMFDIDKECDELLEHYFNIHNKLLTSTLQDADKWKEVVKATNITVPGDMIYTVTEIVNEITNFTDVINVPIHKDEMIKRIDEFLQEVELYNFIHGVDIAVESYIQNALILKNSSSDEVYPDILEQSFENETNETDSSEFWAPPNVFEESGRRIYASTLTTVSRFPFMAAIIIFGQFHCAGSIITKDLIITAASCVQIAYNNRMFRENPAFLAVRVGSTFHAIGGDLISVLEIFFHPSYNPQNLSNNICVLRLVRQIRFRYKRKRDQRVKKIDFDKRDSPLPNNTPEVLMLGWGANSVGNKVPMQGGLRYARLNIYPPKDCQDIYSKDFVSIKNFCAGFVSRGGGACNQDVGDPGIINGLLHGIVSFGGPVCGAPDSPTVFTKIGFYADWIETLIEKNLTTKSKKSTTNVDIVIAIAPTTSTTSEPLIDLVELENSYTQTFTTSSNEETPTTQITHNVGRTAEIDQLPRKKSVKKTKKKATKLYDNYASAQLPDYSYHEYNNKKLEKHKKKHNKHYNRSHRKHKSDKHGDEEFQAQSARSKTPKLHNHMTSSGENKKRTPAKTLRKAKKTKKHKQKQNMADYYDVIPSMPSYPNDYDDIETKFNEPSVHNEEYSKQMKISSFGPKHIHHKKNKHRIQKNQNSVHDQLIHNIHKLKDLNKVNQTDSKPGHNEKNVSAVPASITDNSKLTTEKTFVNGNGMPDYYELNEKHYDIPDNYDYLPTFDSRNKKILEIPDNSGYDMPRQTKTNVKPKNKYQNNNLPQQLKKIQHYEDQEAGEIYEKGDLPDENYGSPEAYQAAGNGEYHEYNSEEYNNNNYKQKPSLKPVTRKETKPEQALSGKINSFSPMKYEKPVLPRDLGKLGSHELKLMFLEQLAKQSGDMSKMATSEHDATTKVSLIPEQNIHMTPINKPLYDKLTGEQNKDEGFYKLIKSAFDQMELKLRQGTATTQAPDENIPHEVIYRYRG